MMTDEAKDQRTAQGHTFLTPEEKAKLRERAAAKGMSQSAYLRYLIVKDFGPLGIGEPEGKARPQRDTA